MRERELAKSRKSGVSSYKFALGRAHEECCQFAIDQMMEHGDFKVGEDVSVTIDGPRLVIEKREKGQPSARKAKP